MVFQFQGQPNSSTYDDWLRQVQQRQGPQMQWGSGLSFLQQTPGQNPGEVTTTVPGNNPTIFGQPNAANSPWLPNAAGETTYNIPSGPGVGPGALAPVVTGQARLGNPPPDTGAPGGVNAPVSPMPQRPLSALGQGAGQAPVAQGAPAWARFTSGNTGASFSNIAKSFDPWGNWGRYGPDQARAPKRHQTAGGMESDIDRVYRWTNDILRTQFGVSGGESADPSLRTQIFLANVERLRNEYKNNNLDWNSSAFAAMERGELALQANSQAAAPGQPEVTPPAAPAAPVAPPPVVPSTTPPAAPGATGGGPAVPEGYKGTNAGAAGNLTAAQRMALASDPQQAYRYMMQQIGYNPSAPGLLGNFLRERFQPLLEARMAASGVSDDANYMDTLDQVINEFGTGLFDKGGGGGAGGGGSFFSNLRTTGENAMRQGSGFLNNLQNQEQAMQYAQQLGQLRYAGSNQLVAQASADEMKRGFQGYQDESFNKELTGQNIDPFQQWLMTQPRYRALFGY